MHRRTKNRLFYISLMVTVTILFSMALAIQKSISIVNKSIDFLGYQIESEERDVIGDELVRYATAVETNITNSNLKGAIPSQIFRKHMNIFSDRKGVSSIYVVNVGYSFEEENENKTISEIIEQLPEKCDKEEINNLLSNTIQELRNIDNSKSNLNVNELLEDCISKISAKTGVSKQNIQNILFKELFVNNKIIISTNRNDDRAQIDSNELNELLSNDSWNEWIAIPKGYLGVNDEAYVDKGHPNLNYNKYIVIAKLDKAKIMGPYLKYKEKSDKVCLSLLIMLIITTVMALSLCAIRFFKMIDRGGEIEPIVRSNTTNNDDASYKLFDWLHRKFK